MNLDQIFQAPASAPAVSATPAQGQSLDSIFGGGQNGSAPASALAGSRAVLPKASQEKTVANPEAGAPAAPTPSEVQRNALDHGGIDAKKAKAAANLRSEQETSERYGSGFAMGEIAGPVKGLKTAARDVNALTKNSSGVSVLTGVTSKIGDTVDKLSDSLYALSKSAQGLKMQWLVDIKNFKPKDWADHAETIYHSFEDPSVALTSRQQYLKDKVIQPIMDKNTKMLQMLRILGVNVGDDVEKYISRVPVGQSKLVDQIQSTVPMNQPKGISTFAPEAQSRKVYGMEGGGEQDLHLVQAKNNSSYQVYRGGKVIGSGKLDATDLANKEVTFSGQKFSLTNSTTKAIEANTPLRYYHDPLLSAVQGNINLNEALRNAQFLEQLKHSPEFKSNVVAPGKDAPAGYREVSVPQLNKYKFSPEVANVIDDFAKTDRGGALGALTNINRVVVGSIFWNPLPHILNVLDHKVVEGGLVGNLKALTVDLPSTMKTAIQAHKEVMTMGPLYRQALKEGAGLIYPSVVTKNFAESMAKQMGTAPEMDAVAKAWNYANPAQMISRVYQHAAKSLWSWNDIIMMHGYIAHMNAGQDLKTAISEVEKHVPNYRIPSTVAGSRQLSQILQNPGVSMFGRYDYGRLASYGHMINDLLTKDGSLSTAQRFHALDQMAMLGVSSMIIYPALDKALQKISGNENANVTRRGAASVPNLAYKLSQGDITPGMMTGSVLPIAPALKVPVELTTGVNTFTGKKDIYTKEGGERYAAGLVSPVGQAESVKSGRKSLGEVAAAQLGLNLPSDKEAAARAKAKKADERRKAKEDAQ